MIARARTCARRRSAPNAVACAALLPAFPEARGAAGAALEDRSGASAAGGGAGFAAPGSLRRKLLPP
jgi:hypothetical protein